MKKIGSILIIFTIASCFAWAEPSISVSISQEEVGQSMPFTLSVVVENSSARPQVPKTEGVYVRGTSTSQSMRFVNGNFSQSTTYIYTMVATKKGEYTIGPITLNEGDKEYKTDTVTIKVVEAKEEPQNQNTANQNGGVDPFERMFGRPRSRSYSVGDDEVFVKTSVSKRKVYVGEPLYIEDEVWTVHGLRLESFEAGSREGFWSEIVSRGYEQQYKEKDGRRYLTKVLHREVLFPVGAGEKTIGSSVYNFAIPQNFTAIPVRRISGKITIEAMPLPKTGRPSSFSGGVGDFSFNASVNTKEIRAHDSLVVKLSVEGEGSTKTIELPNLRDYLPNDVKVFESKEREKHDTTSGKVRGVKTAEYVIVPSRKSEIIIEPIEFSFFNPEKGYETIRSKQIVINVLEGEKREDRGFSSFEQSEIKQIGTDINHIKDGKTRFNKSSYFLLTKWYSVAIIIFWIIAISFSFIYKREEIRMLSDHTYRRSKQGKSQARKRLKRAKAHLQDKDVSSYYAELERALNIYLTGKLNIAPSSVWTDIEDALRKKGVNESLIDSIKHILEECGFARYAPSSDGAVAREEHYKHTEEAITRLEEVI